MIMTKIDVINPLNGDLIDQIVDGVLAPSQLRAAIDRLEREPDGWKRCALAFLEAQCWRESLRLVGEPKPMGLKSGSMSQVQNNVQPIRTSRRWLTNLVAASVVAASFALGWLGHGARLGRQTDETMAARSGELDFKPQNAARVDNPVLTVGNAPGAKHLTTVNSPEEVTTVARLRVRSADAENSLPILAGPGINAEWLKSQPPPVSQYGQAVLEQHGYQVDQRRRLISATLLDGRRVTVPIDQVQIRFTGNNPL
jgi:hypothetical protein